MPKRSYGSGRLYSRKGKGGVETWYGSWWVGSARVKRRVGRKRKQGASEGLTRAQAERELRRLMETEVIVTGAARRSVQRAGEEYIDFLERVMERKPSTIYDYRGYLRKHLVPFFGDRPLDRIEPAHVAGYLKRKRATGLGSKTIQNHLNFLSGLFAFAVRRQWTTSNPVAFVDRPRKIAQSERRVRFLQRGELERLLEAIPKDHFGSVERPLYLTAALTGMRQGELLALRWMDVDFNAGRVRVADSYTRGRLGSPKSHQGRSIPLAARLARELAAHRKATLFAADEDLVFAHPESGHLLDPARVRKRFKQSLARACVREITFHELRHTFGTQMAAAGAPLRAIQEWMGHADAKTTEIYRHYAPDPSNGAVFVDRAFGDG